MLSPPAVEGVEYYGESSPASGLGGEFFDFIAPGRTNLAVALGDVSGHGLGPALLMSGLQGYVHSLTHQKQSAVNAIVSELNRISCDISSQHLVATLFYAQIDPGRNRLRYVNAGHEPALLIRRNRMKIELLGLTCRSTYSVRALDVCPGDVLVACSDGVCEAMEKGSRGFIVGVHGCSASGRRWPVPRYRRIDPGAIGRCRCE